MELPVLNLSRNPVGIQYCKGGPLPKKRTEQNSYRMNAAQRERGRTAGSEWQAGRRIWSSQY